MLWLFFALSAYALLAISAVGDKYLLSKVFPNPLRYAFYVGILGILVIVAVPFLGFPVGDLPYTIAALFSGAMFIVALVHYYSILQTHESSRIIPAIGGVLPLWTLLFTFIVFPDEGVWNASLLALPIFIVASVLITAESPRHVFSKSLGAALVSALLFAIYFVSLKYVYSDAGFWSGFLWTRLGGVVAALVILPFIRWSAKAPSVTPDERPRRLKAVALFFGTKATGALATISQNAAVYVAPAFAISLINALQGTQYVFLIIFTLLLSKKFPAFLKESFKGGAMIQKVGAIALFIVGMAYLALAEN